MSEYKDKFEDSIILIVGSGEQYEEAKQLVKKYNLDDLFIFLGHQDNIYGFYSFMDIFFLPSLYEGLPMVILETMSFSKPIISMNVGSIDEVIKDNGYLIKSGDYDDFIQRLYKLKNNNESIKLLRNKSLEIINKNYKISTYCYKLEQIYNFLNKEEIT